MGAKAKHDFAPTMRRAMFQGLKIAAAEQGITLPEMASQWWKEDWKKAAEVMTKFMPREAHLTGKVAHDHKHTHELVPPTLGFIEGVLRDGASDPSKMVGPKRPLLPVTIPTK